MASTGRRLALDLTKTSLRAALAVFVLAAPGAAQSTFDLLIRDGLVDDGSGSRGFLADVGIGGVAWEIRVAMTPPPPAP